MGHPSHRAPASVVPVNRVEAARLLAVPLGASGADVEQAFRLAARRCHPDLGGDAQAFRQATEARAVMLRPPPPDPVRRVIEVVVRCHPALRLLVAVGRAVERRIPPSRPG